MKFAGRVEDGRDFERSRRGGIGVGIECGFRFGQGGLDRAEVIGGCFGRGGVRHEHFAGGFDGSGYAEDFGSGFGDSLESILIFFG